MMIKGHSCSSRRKHNISNTKIINWRAGTWKNGRFLRNFSTYAIPNFFVSINGTPIKTWVKSVIEKVKQINKGKQNNNGLNTNSAYVLSHLV
jgi:hypothetical protein